MYYYEFVNNLNQLYKPSLTDGQIPFYNTFLQGYSERFLDILWENTMRMHQKTALPAIGELTKYCVGITIASERPVPKKVLTDEEILDTKLGRLSVKQGWTDSYLVHCRDFCIPEQTDEVLLSFQLAQHNAKIGYESLSEKDGGAFDKCLMNLYEDMRRKNSMLQEQYSYLIN